MPKFNRRSTLSTSSVDMISLMDSLSEHFSNDLLAVPEYFSSGRQRSLSLAHDDRKNNEAIDQMEMLDSNRTTFGANVYINQSLSVDPISEVMAQKMNKNIEQWGNLRDTCILFGDAAKSIGRFEIDKIWRLLSHIVDNAYDKQKFNQQGYRFVDEAYPSSNVFVCTIIFQEM